MQVEQLTAKNKSLEKEVHVKSVLLEVSDERVRTMMAERDAPERVCQFALCFSQ